MLYFSICFQRKTVNNSNKSIYCAQYNVIVPFLFLHFFTNQTPPNQHPKFTESNNQNLKPCFYNETKTPKKNPSLRHSVELLRKRKERRKTRKNEIKVLPFLSSETTHWKLRFLKKKTPGKPMYI